METRAWPELAGDLARCQTGFVEDCRRCLAQVVCGDPCQVVAPTSLRYVPVYAAGVAEGARGVGKFGLVQSRPAQEARLEHRQGQSGSGSSRSPARVLACFARGPRPFARMTVWVTSTVAAFVVDLRPKHRQRLGDADAGGDHEGGQVCEVLPNCSRIGLQPCEALLALVHGEYTCILPAQLESLDLAGGWRSSRRTWPPQDTGTAAAAGLGPGATDLSFDRAMSRSSLGVVISRSRSTTSVFATRALAPE
jgi:hypothetical protein